VTLVIAVGPECARAQDTADSGDPECVPLAEQYPGLGTSQSLSARREFVTSWGSFRREGVSPSFWKEGDRVTVRTNPLIDGRPAGNMRGAITSDGQTYGDTRGLKAPAP